MKTYKLNGLEIYTVAFSKKDATLVFIANKMGITEENITETDIEPNRDAIGKVFRSLKELTNYEVQY
jgi:hypothetical protein